MRSVRLKSRTDEFYATIKDAFGSGKLPGGDMLTSRHNCSASEAVALLNCRRLPGRLNSAEAALLLGFQEHDISALVAARLLAPLGKPAPNAPKYFAAVEVEAMARNCDWLGQATKALAKYWVGKNHRKKNGFQSVAGGAALKAA